MQLSVESLSGRTARYKVVTPADAIALVRDGDTIVVEGFMGQCFAEELTLALEPRFLQTGSPQQLTLAFAVAQGNRAGRGEEYLVPLSSTGKLTANRGPRFRDTMNKPHLADHLQQPITPAPVGQAP